MTASTDIKWFRYTNADAPQLTNDWGVLIPVLDACLVTGFSTKVVTSVSISDKVVQLIYDSAPGYYQYQVITVVGANDEQLNGDFRITKVSANGLSVYYELQDSISTTSSSGYITTKLTPLGWEKPYEGVNKAAYRSSNDSLNTRPYLRVLDGLPSNYGTTSNNYAKFARVGIVEEMTSIDNLFGVQSPYDATLPDKNWDTTMVSSTAYPCWSKWYWGYATPSSNSLLTAAPTAGVRDWVLVGDSDRFYFFPNPFPTSTATTYRMTYGFGAYDTVIRNDYSNTFLFTSLDYRAISAGRYLGYMTAASATDPYTAQILLQRNYAQTAVYSLATIISTATGSSGYTTSFTAPNSYATVVPFPCYLKDTSSVVRGNLPNYYFIGQSKPVNDLVSLINNKDEIILPITVLASYSSTIYTGMVLLKLGDL